MRPFSSKLSSLLDEAVYNIERGRWWWKPIKSAIERYIFVTVIRDGKVER